MSLARENGPTPDVSVIVVSYNSRDDTRRCVESVLDHTHDVSVEVLLVDNASSDGTVDVIRAALPDVRVIENAENRGFARACNQGMAAARGDLLLLLNSDATVSDDVIARSAAWMRDHREIGMVGCEVCNERGRRVHTANRRLSIRQSALENLWLYKLIPRSKRAEILLGGYWEGVRPIEVDWLAGAFMLLRREVFETSQGFDPRFFMYGEDSEWCMRLRRAGVRIAFVPSLGRVRHVGAVSSSGVWTEKERLRRCHEGGLRAYAMLNGREKALLYRAVQLSGVTVRYLVYGALARVRPVEYVLEQKRYYGSLRDFYLHPSRQF